MNSGTPKLIQTRILRATLNLLNSENLDENLQTRILKLSQKPLKNIEQKGIIFKKLNIRNLDINFGTHILLPHLSKLLNFLSQKIPKNAKANLNLPIIYLDILNK